MMQRTQPPLTELTRPYWEGCREGVLLLQHCLVCDCFQFYPRTICSHCGADELNWQASSGNGTVASFTVVRRGVSRAYEAPYVVALIDLQEGPRMMSQIVAADPAEVAVGAPVAVAFEAWSDEITLPVFQLDPSGVVS